MQRSDWRERHRGFSLIELLVVLAILGVLISLGYTALRRGGTVSKETVCQGNLKQIALALGLYGNEYKAYPPEDLPVALRPYVGGSTAVFVCPADPDPQGDSYSRYYVSRRDEGTQHYVCGCPRHLGDTGTVTLFSSASAQLLELRPVQWNGQAVRPGTSVGAGVMTFADGSRVTVPSGMVVRLIQSFAMHDGRFYSLIAVDINETGTLEIEVTPGSRFEVVTPAAVTGVQGTRFQVTAAIEGGAYRVKVTVSEGKVSVRHRWAQEPQHALTPGESREVELHRGTIRRLLPKQWRNRRKHLADDYLY